MKASARGASPAGSGSLRAKSTFAPKCQAGASKSSIVPSPHVVRVQKGGPIVSFTAAINCGAEIGFSPLQVRRRSSGASPIARP